MISTLLYPYSLSPIHNADQLLIYIRIFPQPSGLQMLVKGIRLAIMQCYKCENEECKKEDQKSTRSPKCFYLQSILKQ